MGRAASKLKNPSLVVPNATITAGLRFTFTKKLVAALINLWVIGY